MNIPVISKSGDIYRAEKGGIVLFFSVDEHNKPRKVVFYREEDISNSLFEGDSSVLWDSFSEWTKSVVLSRFPRSR